MQGKKNKPKNKQTNKNFSPAAVLFPHANAQHHQKFYNTFIKSTMKYNVLYQLPLYSIHNPHAYKYPLKVALLSRWEFLPSPLYFMQLQKIPYVREIRKIIPILWFNTTCTRLQLYLHKTITTSLNLTNYFYVSFCHCQCLEKDIFCIK